MKRNSPVYLMTFCSVAIAANIVLGIITSLLKLPFYLDTLGTILTAVLVGPFPGAVVGALTNVITGFIYSMRDIPFALVSIAVALITGFIAKKFKFNVITAIITGLILSVVAPLIGTPIGIALYGGLTGTVSDVLVMALKNAGASLFTASFVTKIGNNLIDKVGTCLIAYLLIISLPAGMKSTLKGYSAKIQ
ncbi:CD3073 family putative ECF transporter S component [Anaerocolumna aminovalerica]|jgi:energy-coupling factor transport system substrate-specific component|uniref:CD3073 family putative ECF transporter S component n=1 Tax=Anaerocolumna aminovalerica TaxID=1527 RepID=UPI00248CC382|nr:CD3073 family putative ECF transporter S component [Anaerocolumna aminovalerica]